MPLAAHRSWPELVYHVLAHVEITAHLPASAFDRVYLRWVERSLGSAAARPLGEDASVLGVALGDHEALASVQLLAWLFDDAEVARATAGRELADLGEDEVTRGEVLRSLKRAGPVVELLRCAALLEADPVRDLPALPLPAAQIDAALESLARVAPTLPRRDVIPLRSLRLRGRVRGRDIFVGWPSEALEVSVEHVAWQAAHEATVVEAGAHALQAPPVDERSLEAVALVALAERARQAGLGRDHERWLAHFTGAPPRTVDELGEHERALYETLRSAERRA